MYIPPRQCTVRPPLACLTCCCCCCVLRGGQSNEEAEAAPEVGGVLTPAVAEGECFAFSMCNPPFFESMLVGSMGWRETFQLMTV